MWCFQATLVKRRETSPRSFLGRVFLFSAGRQLKKPSLGGLGEETERTQTKGEHLGPCGRQIVNALISLIWASSDGSLSVQTHVLARSLLLSCVPYLPAALYACSTSWVDQHYWAIDYPGFPSFLLQTYSFAPCLQYCGSPNSFFLHGLSQPWEFLSPLNPVALLTCCNFSLSISTERVLCYYNNERKRS